jgi:hypothetical protein
MSYFGRTEDAKREGEKATHVIDGETSTSPIRDGGTDVGGAPIATGMGGTTEFTQARTRTGIHDTQKTVRRQYGQDHKVSPK